MLGCKVQQRLRVQVRWYYDILRFIRPHFVLECVIYTVNSGGSKRTHSSGHDCPERSASVMMNIIICWGRYTDKDECRRDLFDTTGPPYTRTLMRFASPTCMGRFAASGVSGWPWSCIFCMTWFITHKFGYINALLYTASRYAVTPVKKNPLANPSFTHG